ncbi:hypothetical protein CUC53_06450 [Aeromonas cavernicola]|uniref:Uncharacterized protein n=2 Tax=Aeromonas cavernicola TaxID=1006623 RepID=A0A2H9U687_9GAMM|nr:hypothetical protein CUC53_06450 [Aeromonas cavernicola]
MNRTSLLLMLILAHGVAFAAPKHHDDENRSRDDIKLDINWDQKEYDWWQSNCLDVGFGDNRIQLNCDKVESKYREHYNRSVHGEHNPGKGHNKHKAQDKRDKSKKN